MKRLTQTGSHIIALAVGLLVVGGIAFAGYTVMNRQNTPDQTTTNAAANTDSATTLDSAASQLNSSSSQLDSNLDDTALDADLNDML